MPMPKDIGVIDLMLAVPGDDTSHFYEWIKPMLMELMLRPLKYGLKGTFSEFAFLLIIGR